MTQEPPPLPAPAPSSLARFGNPLGTVVGLALGYYAGLTLLIPIAFGALIGFALFKAAPSRKAIALPIAVVGGHVAWIILGCALLGRWRDLLPEIVLLGGLSIWLFARPGKVLLLVFAGLNFLESIYSSFMLFQQEFATDLHKAHLVHASLYVMAGALLVKEFVERRRAPGKGGQLPAPGAGNEPSAVAETEVGQGES